MKNVLFYMSFILIVACNNEDQENSSISKIDNKMLEGEWVSVNTSGTYYTDIILSGSSWTKVSVIRKDIGENSVVDSDEGVWSWYDDNNSLAINTTKLSIPIYQVLEVTIDSLLMHNRSYNTTEAYQRVVESVEVNAGDTTSIKYISGHSDLAVDDITIVNKDIADVYKNGVVYGKQGGVTFVLIRSGQKTYYVKISVVSRLDRYAEQTKLKINDIVKLYGVPDEISETNVRAYTYVTQMGGVYVYKRPKTDMELSELAYTFDYNNGVIYQVGIKYGRDQTFSSDLSFIQKYYYTVSEPEVQQLGDYTIYDFFYGKNKVKSDNSYLVFIDYYESKDVKYGMFIGFMNIDY